MQNERLEHQAMFIAVIVFAVIVYWISSRLSIQKVFNEGMYTGDHKLEDVVELPVKVKLDIKKGKQLLSESKLIIAGCLRDRADHVDKIRRMTERMGSIASDYRVLVVENDSSDSTRKELLKWSKQNDKVEVLGCGVNESECKLNLQRTYQWDINNVRMDKMRLIRNIYLDRIKEVYSDWDYLLVWDYDLEGCLYWEGVCHAATLLSDKVVGVAAYGHYVFLVTGTHYYDPFAYVPVENIKPVDESIIVGRKPDKMMWNLKLIPGQVSPCTSAFAGAALYKVSSVIKSSYSLKQSDDKLECEHVTFSRGLGGSMVVDGAMWFPVLENPRFA